MEGFSTLMTFGAPESASANNARIPSIVILGADAVLAALPATPIQLAHACVLAGYQNVVPASWGDELIAAASLRALRHHGQLPAIQCSCPYVAHRLLAVGTDLRPFLVSLVAPPVVLARYLRAAHTLGKLRITYVGRCPGAADEAIDARLTPEELLAIFADRQIVPAAQSDVFDSILPPDRRRFRSQPGGLPTAEMLWSTSANGGAGRSLVELYGDELPVELAQHLLAGVPVLIDVAPKLGCVCSGATSDIDPAHARTRVTELEPPRAPSPVLDERVQIEAILPLPASPRSAIDVVSPPVGTVGSHGTDTDLPNGSDDDWDVEPETEAGGSTGHVSTIGRRHSPSRGVTRPVSGNLPTARDADGRQLPRTYVARRRSPSRITRTTPSSATPAIAREPSRSDAPSTAEPNEPLDAAPPITVALETDSSGGEPEAIASPPLATAAASAGLEENVERPSPLRAPANRVRDERGPDGRFSERAVALPVTPLSDARPSETLPPHSGGETPVMQLLTLGLLIAMIVLVSAAVGVLVGRWMTQH
jgi:hypothetical protein